MTNYHNGPQRIVT